MSVFSFINHPMEYVLKHIHSMLPGIERVIAIYYCKELNEIKVLSAIEKNTNNTKMEDFSYDSSSAFIEKLRKTNSYFSWQKKNDLPFEISAKKNEIQMNVFQEIDNNVLCLGFHNEEMNNYDLLFVYFNKTMKNFGISGTDKLLNPDHKNIIGFMLYNNIKSLINSLIENKNVLNAYNADTKSIIKKYTHVKKELEHTKNNYGLSLVDLCKLYVKEFSENNTRFNYILSDEALTKIRDYKGDINALKTIIQKAINYINNLYYDSEEADLYISEEYLNFEDTVSPISKPQEVQLFSRYSKTILLLDRLENASRNVIAQKLDLTGVNVGNSFSPPISAPAISDALKKHKNKIIHLFNEYPDKWAIIRKEFRPVKNIISPRSEIIEKSA